MVTQPKPRADEARVLVVDDYADARFIVREILSYSGFEVLERLRASERNRGARTSKAMSTRGTKRKNCVNGWSSGWRISSR